MRSLLISVLAASISFGAFAQDYACKGAYEKEVGHLLKTGQKHNKVIQRAWIASAIIESVAFNTTVYAGSLAIYSPFTVGFFVAGTGWLIYKSDKFEAHLTAQSIIEESFTGKEEVEARTEEAYYSLQQERAERKVRKLNKKLRKAGKPEITVEDFLKQNPIAAFNKASVKTPLTSLAKKMNKSYEELSVIIRELSQDNTFCPRGNAMGKRQLQKVLAEKLN